MPRRWLKKMSSVGCVLGLLLVNVNVVSAADNTEAAPSDPKSVARVQAALSSLSRMEAGFYQRLIGPEQQVIDEKIGHFYLSRPGKFRWDYFAEEDSAEQKKTEKSQGGQREVVETIISDGEQIYLYDADLEVVTIRSMQNAINQVPSLVLVSDQVKVKDVFNVTELPPSLGLHWFFLKPKSADAGYTELRLGFDKEQLTAFSILDVLGQTTQLQFNSISQRPVFDAALFDFVVPDGVDVNREL